MTAPAIGVSFRYHLRGIDMATKAPGKSFRKGLTLIEVMGMFPDEKAATRWLESHVWPSGRCCGKCGATNTAEVPNAKPMPCWCPDCRSYFSVRTGTALSHRQFVGKHNLREEDTIDIMRNVVARLIGRRLMYRQLIADNGLPSGARS